MPSVTGDGRDPRLGGVQMLRIHFTADDYVRTTLASAPDPLWEVLLSLHQLQIGDGPQLFGSGRRLTRPNVSPPLTRPLLDLAPPHGYSPDFLTPTQRPGDFGESLDTLLSTSRHRIRDELAYLASRTSTTPWTRQAPRDWSTAARQPD